LNKARCQLNGQLAPPGVLTSPMSPADKGKMNRKLS